MAVPFATGPLLWSDDFDEYPDGAVTSVTDGAWLNPLWSGQGPLRILSGDLAGGAAAGWHDAYSAQALGLGDYIFHVATKPDDDRGMWLDVLAAAPGTTPISFVVNALAGTDRMRLFRDGSTTLVDVNREFASGDALGIRVESGGLVSLWHLPSGDAGSAVQVGTTQEIAGLPSSGRIGVETNTGNLRVSRIEFRSLVPDEEGVEANTLGHDGGELATVQVIVGIPGDALAIDDEEEATAFLQVAPGALADTAAEDDEEEATARAYLAEPPVSGDAVAVDEEEDATAAPVLGAPDRPRDPLPLDGVPHLAWPLRLAGARLDTVEQDTLVDVRQCVHVLLRTPLNARPLAPTVGVEDPTFSTGVDPLVLAGQVEGVEDRARLRVEALGPDGGGRQRVYVHVELAGQEDEP